MTQASSDKGRDTMERNILNEERMRSFGPKGESRNTLLDKRDR